MLSKYKVKLKQEICHKTKSCKWKWKKKIRKKEKRKKKHFWHLFLNLLICKIRKKWKKQKLKLTLKQLFVLTLNKDYVKRVKNVNILMIWHWNKLCQKRLIFILIKELNYLEKLMKKMMIWKIGMIKNWMLLLNSKVRNTPNLNLLKLFVNSLLMQLKMKDMVGNGCALIKWAVYIDIVYLQTMYLRKMERKS
jgi:hypothetical protein